jgi:SAM-dependent methyltransferase
MLRDGWQAERVIAADRSRAMLQRIDAASAVPVCADMAALPFAAAAFDACLCSMVLHYSDDPRAVCRDVRRILRPGGVLYVRTGTQESIASFAFLRYFPEALAAERKVMPCRDEIVAWICDAGFTEVRSEEVVLVPVEGRWRYVRKALSRGFPSMQLVSPVALMLGAVRLIVGTAVAALLRRPLAAERTLVVTGTRP